MSTLKSLAFAAAAVLFTGGLSGTAGASQDDLIEAGRKVFNSCRACHDINTEKNKVGPELKTLMGRRAGALESYTRFSDAMKNSGIVWDEASLDKFLTNPRGAVPGTKMFFRGLKKEQQRKAIIAYINSMQKK